MKSEYDAGSRRRVVSLAGMEMQIRGRRARRKTPPGHADCFPAGARFPPILVVRASAKS